MHLVLVGRGKLAAELQDGFRHDALVQLWAWPETPPGTGVVVHAGSGRELDDAVAFCARTGAPLIELASGSALEASSPCIPVVLCPNTNLLMVKVMRMLVGSAHLFRGTDVSLLESHQASKTTAPGTAMAMASALGLPAGAVRSVRDPVMQREDLSIPQEHLGRHAFHRLRIAEGECSVTIETLVLGSTPYVDGLRRIVLAVAARQLEPRQYTVDEFLEKGWLDADA